MLTGTVGNDVRKLCGTNGQGPRRLNHGILLPENWLAISFAATTTKQSVVLRGGRDTGAPLTFKANETQDVIKLDYKSTNNPLKTPKTGGETPGCGASGNRLLNLRRACWRAERSGTSNEGIAPQFDETVDRDVRLFLCVSGSYFAKFLEFG